MDKNLVQQLLQAIGQIQQGIQPGLQRVKQAWQEDPQQFNYLTQNPLWEVLTRRSPFREPLTPADAMAFHGGVQAMPGISSGLNMSQYSQAINNIQRPPMTGEGTAESEMIGLRSYLMNKGVPVDAVREAPLELLRSMVQNLQPSVSSPVMNQQPGQSFGNFMEIFKSLLRNQPQGGNVGNVGTGMVGSFIK